MPVLEHHLPRPSEDKLITVGPPPPRRERLTIVIMNDEKAKQKLRRPTSKYSLFGDPFSISSRDPCSGSWIIKFPLEPAGSIFKAITISLKLYVHVVSDTDPEVSELYWLKIIDHAAYFYFN